MSLVIAVKENDRVLMGADTQTSRGDEKYSIAGTETQKIHLTPNGVVVGTAGLVRVLQQLTCHPEWFEELPPEGLTKEFLVRRIAPALLECIDGQNLSDEGDRSEEIPHAEFSAVFAQGDRIFVMESDYSVFAMPGYAAIGCGCDAANAVFADKRNPDEPAKEKLLRALRFADRLDSAVGAPFLIVDTERNTMERIDA